MKNFKVLLCLLSIVFTAACTKSAERNEAASSDIKGCNFDVLVFSSYQDESGKLTYDYEKMPAWSREGTHDYAVLNSSEVVSASVKILKDGKPLNKIELLLEKAGENLIKLNDKGEIKTQLRSLGELKPEMALSFTFNTKAKKICSKDVGISAE